MLVQRVGAGAAVLLGSWLVAAMATSGESHPAADPACGGSVSADRSVDPCVDFYQYACANWLRNNPVPPDRARYGRFDELADRNLLVLKDILEDTSHDSQIGSFYGACMDTEAIATRGALPLGPFLAGIEAVKSREDLADNLAQLHAIGVDALFSFSSEQALREAPLMVALVDQAGIGLPDRDDYTRDDADSEATRTAYRAYIRRTFGLLGDADDRAKLAEERTMTIEAALAAASMSRVDRRDPLKRTHMMSVADLEQLAPAFDWERYFHATGAPEFARLDVGAPDFVRRVNTLLIDTPPDALKDYLRFRLANSLSQVLSPAFVDVHDSFYETVLRGRREAPPRWKRCIGFANGSLGEAVGKRFVERTFSPEAKERTLALVHAIETALREDIEGLPWMTEETKRRALEKLSNITNKIGYPDHFRDYGSVLIKPDDFFGNVVRADRFEFARTLRKIGHDADKSEWDMLPQTVNAYYDAQQNSITFPAAILAAPFFAPPTSPSPAADDGGAREASDNVCSALDYGGIGAVIGHELSHGFDDEGRMFDSKGNYDDTWRPQDATAFNERAQCFVREYDGFTAIGDIHVNGHLTLGENIADNGGLRLALAAFQHAIGPADGAQEGDGGFTTDQRLFLAYAGIWCQNVTPENARVLAITDPHSPARARVNGVVANMSQFAEAFGCAAGQPMVRAAPCREF